MHCRGQLSHFLKHLWGMLMGMSMSMTAYRTGYHWVSLRIIEGHWGSSKVFLFLQQTIVFGGCLVFTWTVRKGWKFSTAFSRVIPAAPVKVSPCLFWVRIRTPNAGPFSNKWQFFTASKGGGPVSRHERWLGRLELQVGARWSTPANDILKCGTLMNPKQSQAWPSLSISRCPSCSKQKGWTVGPIEKSRGYGGHGVCGLLWLAATLVSWINHCYGKIHQPPAPAMFGQTGVIRVGP